jgi:lipoate-protein ligase A
MLICDLSLPTPAENLACEEALLDWCEAGDGSPLLRFWEPEDYFVVVGYGNRVSSEVNTSFCRQRGIPILRRCSGGGTVLQGPGCLNYCLVLPTDDPAELRSIPSTNRFVMERNRAALELVTGRRVEIKGHSDLVIGNLKFSGNAQRRRLRYLIFHGCFLLNMDLDRIQEALVMPSKEPDYRAHRPHTEFLMNLEVSASTAKNALAHAWEADVPLSDLPIQAIQALALEKYTRKEWNLKF